MSRFFRKIGLQKDKSIFSVEVQFTTDNQYVAYYCQLKNNKKGVSFDVSKVKPFQSLSDIKSEIKKGSNIILTLTGRGVITKKIIKTEDYQFSLKQAIPNINEEDFYYQIYDCGEHLFVTIIRKQICENIFKEVQNNLWLIDQLYLGNISGFTLGSITGNTSIQFGGSRIDFDDNIPSSLVPDSSIAENINIDNQLVEGNLLTVLGSGFSYYLSPAGFSVVDAELLLQFKNEIIYKRLLNQIGFGSLAVILLLLVFNQYVQGHYQQTASLLEEILSTTANERNQVAVLKQELNEKQGLIASTGLFNPVKLSFYADEITKDIPDDITLDDLFINPLPGNKMDDGEKGDFILGLIEIKGTVTNTSALNKWVKKLKQLSWSKEVLINEYNQEQKTAAAEFVVHVSIGQ